MEGDHWKGGGLHYFLHANLSGGHPMAIRRGVQLVVITDRLFAEREMDALILRAEGIFGEAQEDDNPVRARLKARIGAPTSAPYALPWENPPIARVWSTRPFRILPPSFANPIAQTRPTGR